jgi:hypothetical protein
MQARIKELQKDSFKNNIACNYKGKMIGGYKY